MERADQDRQADDAVARDHYGGEHGIASQRLRLAFAADHQRDDQGDFDHCHRNSQHQRAVRLTDTMCHDLGRIRLGHRSPEEWEETLISMLNEGAPLSDEQFPVIHAYLSRHFGIE